MRLDAKIPKGIAHRLAPVFHGAEEYRYVAGLGLSNDPGFSVIKLRANDRCADLGDVPCLGLFFGEIFTVIIDVRRVICCAGLRLGLVLFQKYMDLRDEVVLLVALDTGIEHRALVVTLHDPFEYIVDVPDSAVVGPEILAEHDGELVLIIAFAEALIQALEYLRRGLAELVNALLDISYPEYVIRPGDTTYEALLDVVGILVFIHEYVLEALSKNVSRLFVF